MLDQHIYPVLANLEEIWVTIFWLVKILDFIIYLREPSGDGLITICSANIEAN